MLLSTAAITFLLLAPPAPAAPAAPASPAPPAAPAKAPAAADGFLPLFDSTTLKGWKAFSPDAGGDKAWSVKDGTIVCEGNPIGYLVTEESYESFELTLEWRFDPTKGAGNSGVLLRVQEPDKVWPKSLEAQLHSENAGDIWNIDAVPMRPEPSRTEGRRTKKEHPTNERPLGEWNRYRIVLDGGRLELFVNDLLQNVATDVEVKPGRIALQAEGAHIEFRSIRIRPIRHAPATK
jgi:hypothetical protein